MTFDKKIVIQNLTVTTDEIGNDIENYSDLYTLWANANGLYGTEYWAAAGQGQENTINFTVRWFSALDDLMFDKDLTKYRIKFKNRYFDIKGFDNVKFKNLFVEIKAVAN
jgi:SPP1 family predicted phage head-tail adaptor